MNKVILIGNVGNAPEIKTLESGVKLATFSLATAEKFTNKQGEKVGQTDWHRLEVWNGLTKVCETIIQKGDRLCIEGKIKTEKWEDKDGNPRTTTKILVQRIELLGNRREQIEKQESHAENQAPEASKTKGKGKKSKVVFEADEDKDLPF